MRLEGANKCLYEVINLTPTLSSVRCGARVYIHCIFVDFENPLRFLPVVVVSCVTLDRSENLLSDHD